MWFKKVFVSFVFFFGVQYVYRVVLLFQIFARSLSDETLIDMSAHQNINLGPTGLSTKKILSECIALLRTCIKRKSFVSKPG